MEENNFYTEEQKQKIISLLLHLDIPFRSLELYLEAFTHGSYTNTKDNFNNYQRLEFLGDAVVDCEASYFVFINYPQFREGEMTKLRAQMIQEQTLSYLSEILTLDKFIFLGKNMAQEKLNNKIKSDVFEALVGAIYIDQGQKAVRSFFKKHFFNKIEDIIKRIDVQDYKTKLQEELQAKSSKVLKYRVISSKLDKATNSSMFHVGVYIQDNLLAKGIGNTRKKAEQEAAKNALINKADHN